VWREIDLGRVLASAPECVVVGSVVGGIRGEDNNLPSISQGLGVQPLQSGGVVQCVVCTTKDVMPA